MAIASINPTTGKTLETYSALTSEQIEQALTQAQAAFLSYPEVPFAQRKQWMHRAADVLLARKDDFGRTMTLEMGKPLKSAIAEVEKCAWVCRYYADEAEGFLQDEPAKTDASESYVRFRRCFVGGDAVELSVLAGVSRRRTRADDRQSGFVETCVQRATLSAGDRRDFHRIRVSPAMFQTLLIGPDPIESIIADPRVKAVTLTGSGPAGSAVAAAAAKHIKKAVLELGGSDPFIVLPSANLADAIATAATARLLNNGQSCIAAKRFILVGDIADDFEKAFAQQFQQKVVGDPLKPETDIGPLATPGILKELDEQVQACVDKGAIALVGADIKALKQQLPTDLQAGNFYPPTILTHIPPGTPADQEEFFGPVALVFRVPDLESAIALANSTTFGLGASAWTTDPVEQQQLINQLDAGAVFINGLVKSDPRLPFGGIKQSGYGRGLRPLWIVGICQR